MKPEETAIKGRQTDLASKRMEDLMQSQGYGPNAKKLDAVLSPADAISTGVIFTLKRHGYTPSNIPVITAKIRLLVIKPKTRCKLCPALFWIPSLINCIP